MLHYITMFDMNECKSIVVSVFKHFSFEKYFKILRPFMFVGTNLS